MKITAALIVGGLILAAAQPVLAKEPVIVTIRVIPHSQQRYPTVGDWQFDRKGNLKISVSKMGDHRYETLVAAHELVEAILCRQAGVSERTVDAFDKRYEAHRKPGDFSEPGDDPKAPYHRQHVAAAKIERELAAELGVDWESYSAAIEAMP